MRHPVPYLAVAQWGDHTPLGGLAIACVHVDDRGATALTAQDLEDPGRLPAALLASLARRVEKVVPAEVVSLTARKYNSLLGRTRSRDRLLDWAYRKAVEGLAVRYPGTRGLVHGARAPAFALLVGDVRGTEDMIMHYVPVDRPQPGLAAAEALARAAWEQATRRSLRSAGLQALDPSSTGASLAAVARDHGAATLLTVAKRDDPAVRAALGEDTPHPA